MSRATSLADGKEFESQQKPVSTAVASLSRALRVTRALIDDVVVIDEPRGITTDEATLRLWVDVMHPTGQDTWHATLIAARGVTPEAAAAAFAYRARHFAHSVNRERVAS